MQIYVKIMMPPKQHLWPINYSSGEDAVISASMSSMSCKVFLQQAASQCLFTRSCLPGYSLILSGVMLNQGHPVGK